MSKNSERVKRWRMRHPDRARDARAIENARRGGYAAPTRRECEIPRKPSDGLCELCRQRTPVFHNDHCHSTGHFRGWLCIRCNLAMGNFEAIGSELISEYCSGKLPWQ